MRKKTQLVWFGYAARRSKGRKEGGYRKARRVKKLVNLEGV